MSKKPVTTEKPLQESRRISDAVLSVMDSLSVVMDKETALLKTHDLAAIQTLHEQKAKLVRAYHGNMLTLKQTPDLLKGEPEEVRLKLRHAGEKLRVCVARNADALRIAVSATKSVIQTVVNAARDQSKSTDCYHDPRKTPFLLGSYSPLCPPTAVDRTA